MDLIQNSFPRPMWYTQFLNSTHLDPLEDHQEVGDKDAAAELEVLEEVHVVADDGSWHCRSSSYHQLSQMMNEIFWEALNCFWATVKVKVVKLKLQSLKKTLPKAKWTQISSALNLLKASFQSTFINSRFITAQSRHCLQREESRTRCELLQSK